MKAIQVNQNFKADVIDAPMPVNDGSKVIVKVEKCGICGSDAHMLETGDTSNKGVRPGHEFSGTVVDPGPRSDLKVGDRVVSNFMNPCGKCDACKSGNIGCCLQSSEQGGLGLTQETPGGMAEYVACFPDFVYVIPEDTDFTLAALVDPVAVALHAVVLGRVTIGDKVLITGGGAIGLSAALLCKRAGASLVVMTETHPDKLKSIPADFPEIDGIVDAHDPELMVKLGTISMGGFDACIECCGYEDALTTALCLLKVSGRLILAGVSLINVSIPSVIALIREIEIKGSMAYLEKEYVQALHMMSDPELDFGRIITKNVPIEAVEEEMKKLQAHTTSDYKIMVDLNL